jgi:hypothetical protein
MCLFKIVGLILGVEHEPYIYCMQLRIAQYIIQKSDNLFHMRHVKCSEIRCPEM